jgi:hypothetical protein
MAEYDSLSREFNDKCQSGELENGKVITIVCSNCKTPLVEIWRTRPTVQVVTNVVAKCGMCGDKSYTVKVAGGFHFANVETSPVAPNNTEPGPTTRDDNDNVVMSLTITTGKIK